MKKIITKLFLIMVLSLTSISNELFAQIKTVSSDEMNLEAYNMVLIIVLIVLFHLVFIPLIFPGAEQSVAAEGIVKEKKNTILKILKDKLSGAKPIEEESSILLEDNFDGIGELDNKVPPWFNILFHGTIVFALIYFLNYHFFNTGKLPFQEYADEVKAAELLRAELIRTGAFINENNVILLTDPESINSGKQVFTANCVPCHGNNAEGTVGPNLTDQYWIHGGGVTNVFKTVKYGVPVKGMISWQNQFNPRLMQQVVSYVLSLQGTNLAGKGPEGEKYVETDTIKTKSDSSGTDNLTKDRIKADTLTLKK